MNASLVSAALSGKSDSTPRFEDLEAGTLITFQYPDREGGLELHRVSVEGYADFYLTGFDLDSQKSRRFDSGEITALEVGSAAEDWSVAWVVGEDGVISAFAAKLPKIFADNIVSLGNRYLAAAGEGSREEQQWLKAFPAAELAAIIAQNEIEDEGSDFAEIAKEFIPGVDGICEYDRSRFSPLVTDAIADQHGYIIYVDEDGLPEVVYQAVVRQEIDGGMAAWNEAPEINVVSFPNSALAAAGNPREMTATEKTERETDKWREDYIEKYGYDPDDEEYENRDTGDAPFTHPVRFIAVTFSIRPREYEAIVNGGVFHPGGERHTAWNFECDEWVTRDVCLNQVAERNAAVIRELKAGRRGNVEW